MEAIKDYIKDKKTNKIVLPRIKAECIDDIATITNQLANINYLLNQSISENYTDDTEAYVKQISDGTSPFGRLDMVGGKSMGGYAVVDLGSLVWKRYLFGEVWAFYANIPTRKSMSTNCYQNRYTVDNTATASLKDKEITYIGNTTYLYVRDDSFTDATAFTNSMQGVNFLYEQANPSGIYNVELTEIISKGANRDIATYPTSDIIKKYFPQGMKSAGSVYDEFNLVKGKAIHRIGVVDLGSLTWTYATNATNPYFTAGLSEAKKAISQNDVANLICKSYETKAYNDTLWIGTNDKCIAMNSTSFTLVICDKSYTNASALKSALNNVLLFFELATPTETDISNADIEALKTLEVEANGTITMQNEFHLAIPSSQTFQRIRGVASLFEAESEDTE